MNLQHANVRIFVDGDLTVDLERFMEIFHRWIADQALEELLIDVADYRHVPTQPSVLLVGHEGNYSIEKRDSGFALRYNCKAAREGDARDRLAHALGRAADVCTRLEAEVDGLRFDRGRFELFFNDRALAPNTDETQQICQESITSLLQSRLGQEAMDFQFDRDPRHLLAATVTLSQPLDLAAFSTR